MSKHSSADEKLKIGKQFNRAISAKQSVKPENNNPPLPPARTNANNRYL